MKNEIALIGVILLLFLFLSPICEANVFVSPSSMSITMTDTYVEGNTSEKITVTNRYSYNISVSAWMMQPDIVEWMRPNRTLIDNISWISIDPSNLLIPSGRSACFYIYLTIPDEARNQTYDKHWEVWAALMINSASENVSSSFKQGYNVRVYVDTPVQPIVPDEPQSPGELIYYAVIAFVIVILLIVIFYFYLIYKKRT